MVNNIVIDHADIVTSHMCNNHCKFCVDKFIHTSSDKVSMENIGKFLQLLRMHTNERLEVLLLGGEPTMLETEELINIAKLIHSYGFSPIMSTNGIDKEKIRSVLPYYDWVQVTVHRDSDIDYWRDEPHKINIKLSGDSTLDIHKLRHFIAYTEGFERRSVSMYFTPDFEQLCKDEDIWNLLDFEITNWKRNGSYVYGFYEGVRFKKCIPGETNIIDEPTVPKLYPNGNYNKTWCNEEMDTYLGEL